MDIRRPARALAHSYSYSQLTMERSLQRGTRRRRIVIDRTGRPKLRRAARPRPSAMRHITRIWTGVQDTSVAISGVWRPSSAITASRWRPCASGARPPRRTSLNRRCKRLDRPGEDSELEPVRTRGKVVFPEIDRLRVADGTAFRSAALRQAERTNRRRPSTPPRHDIGGAGRCPACYLAVHRGRKWLSFSNCRVPILAGHRASVSGSSLCRRRMSSTLDRRTAFAFVTQGLSSGTVWARVCK